MQVVTEQRFRIGKIALLLAQIPGFGWGPPNDFLDTEAVVKVQDSMNESFGIKLRAGDDGLSAQLAMFALLRDAFAHDYTVALHGRFEPGKLNGHLARVTLASTRDTLESLESEAVVTLPTA